MTAAVMSGGTRAERFRQIIALRVGLNIEEDRLEWLGGLLNKRARARNCSQTALYLDALEQGIWPEEWAILAPELTVAESYFFRHIEQFNALQFKALPERIAAARAGTGRLRILSAGCAHGEEAYSIAMTLAAMPEAVGLDVRIDALDINPQVIKRAREGRYREWSLRETPSVMRERWFSAMGEFHQLNARIRQSVQFACVNLADGNASFWQPSVYDVVFCRNVLMYFTPQQNLHALARLTSSIACGGYLFLGHAESLRERANAFRLQHTHGTFYYQRKSAEALADTAITPAQSFPGAQKEDANWVQAIERATQRVKDLAQGASAGGAACDTTNVSGGQQSMGAAAVPVSINVDDVLNLFRQERFGDALKQIANARAGMPPSALAAMLHPLLLLHAGQAGEAESLCRQLIEQDELHADLHHVLALCQEANGDLVGAIDSDQTAAYLDPRFAMPHLHLGLLARRQSDPEGCRRAWTMALRLLDREEGLRIDLFGGGFGREALRAMCRAELAPSGAPR